MKNVVKDMINNKAYDYEKALNDMKPINPNAMNIIDGIDYKRIVIVEFIKSVGAAGIFTVFMKWIDVIKMRTYYELFYFFCIVFFIVFIASVCKTTYRHALREDKDAMYKTNKNNFINKNSSRRFHFWHDFDYTGSGWTTFDKYVEWADKNKNNHDL